MIVKYYSIILTIIYFLKVYNTLWFIFESSFTWLYSQRTVLNIILNFFFEWPQ